VLLNLLCSNFIMELDLNVRIAAEVLDGLHGEWLRRQLVKAIKALDLLPEDFAGDWGLWEEHPATTAWIAAKAIERERRQHLPK
jgi:hypothetical protein